MPRYLVRGIFCIKPFSAEAFFVMAINMAGVLIMLPFQASLIRSALSSWSKMGKTY